MSIAYSAGLVLIYLLVVAQFRSYSMPRLLQIKHDTTVHLACFEIAEHTVDNPDLIVACVIGEKEWRWRAAGA